MSQQELKKQAMLYFEKHHIELEKSVDLQKVADYVTEHVENLIDIISAEDESDFLYEIWQLVKKVTGRENEQVLHTRKY